MWFYVTGIPHPAALTPGIDVSVLIGHRSAEKGLGIDGNASVPELLPAVRAARMSPAQVLWTR